MNNPYIFLKLFLKGILMGIANIIPGVSGGTLAVVLNIYDELINSINQLFSNFKKSFAFLLPIFIGVIVGIVAFSSIIKFGLTYHSFATNMFFVGLVVGSIPLIYGKACENKYDKKNIILAIVSFSLIIFLSTIKEQSNINTQINFSTFTYLKLFLGGAVAAGAMIIPGISGSFLLMLMGIYPLVIGAISSSFEYLKNWRNFELLFYCLKIIIPVGLGIVVGIFLVAKLISIALEKAQSKTYFIVLGLIFGSVFSIFANSNTYLTGFNTIGVVISVFMFLIGLFISIVLGK